VTEGDRRLTEFTLLARHAGLDLAPEAMAALLAEIEPSLAALLRMTRRVRTRLAAAGEAGGEPAHLFAVRAGVEESGA